MIGSVSGACSEDQWRNPTQRIKEEIAIEPYGGGAGRASAPSGAGAGRYIVYERLRTGPNVLRFLRFISSFQKLSFVFVPPGITFCALSFSVLSYVYTYVYTYAYTYVCICIYIF